MLINVCLEKACPKYILKFYYVSNPTIYKMLFDKLFFFKKPKKASVDHVILASGTFLLFLHGGIWIPTTEHPHFRQSMTGLYCALVNAGGQLLGDSEDDDVKED